LPFSQRLNVIILLEHSEARKMRKDHELPHLEMMQIFDLIDITDFSPL
jgi:hypothetical protein